jgi:hypothetical protein
MGWPDLRFARAVAAVALAAALLGGCGADGEAESTANPVERSATAPAAADAAPAPGPTAADKPAPGGGDAAPAVRPGRADRAAGGRAAERRTVQPRHGDRPAGGARREGSLAGLTKAVERRLARESGDRARPLRELAEEALADPDPERSAAGRSAREIAEQILSGD